MPRSRRAAKRPSASERAPARASKAVAIATPGRLAGRLRLVGPAVFFLLLFLFFDGVVDPRLTHHGFGILAPYHVVAFKTGSRFFWEQALHVGGLADYLARLLFQWFPIRGIGAAVLTASAVAAAAIARALGRPLPARGEALGYVPAALLLVLYCSYAHPLRSWLGVLAAAAAFLLYRWTAPQTAVWRMAFAAGLSTAMYAAMGAASLVLPLLVMLDELLVRGRKQTAGIALLIGIALPGAAVLLRALGPAEAFAGFALADPGVPPQRWPAMLALFLFFPTVFAAAALWGKDRPAAHERTATLLLQTAAACLLLTGLGWLAVDRPVRTTLAVDLAVAERRWDDALRAAENLPPGVYSVRCDRNLMLALYHTGRLADRWFADLRGPASNLLNTPEGQADGGTSLQESQVLLELGCVNDAQKAAFEALEASGEQPAVLEQLALIEIVRGRPETARMFLRALARQPLDRAEALAWLERLHADPAMEDDARVRSIRASALRRETLGGNESVETMLLTLLESNPRNRLAFELLMGHYLGAKQLDKAVAEFPRLKELGYAAPPILLQEAWLIHCGPTPRPFPVKGMAVDDAVLRRAAAFQAIAGAGPRGASIAGREELAGSYFLYYLLAADPRD